MIETKLTAKSHAGTTFTWPNCSWSLADISTTATLFVFRYILKEAASWINMYTDDGQELLTSQADNEFDGYVCARVEIYSRLAENHQFWPDLMLAVGADEFQDFLFLIKKLREPMLRSSSKIYIDMMIQDIDIILSDQRADLEKDKFAY